MTTRPDPSTDRLNLLTSPARRPDRYDTIELTVCQDCILFLANGDGPEHLLLDEDGERKYDDRLAAIVAGVERVQSHFGGNLHVGGPHEAEDGRVDDDRGSWGEFTCAACQVEDSANDRYAANVLVPVYDPPTGLAQAFEVVDDEGTEWGHRLPSPRRRRVPGASHVFRRTHGDWVYSVVEVAGEWRATRHREPGVDLPEEVAPPIDNPYFLILSVDKIIAATPPEPTLEPTPEWITDSSLSVGDYGGAGTVGESNQRAVKELAEELGHEVLTLSYSAWERFREDRAWSDDEEVSDHLIVELYGSYGSRTIWLRDDVPEFRELVEALADYPLLDEDLHSQVEIEWEEQAWDDWIRADLVGTLDEDLRERAEWLHDGTLFGVYRQALEACNGYPTFEHAGVYVDTARIADTFAELLAEVPDPRDGLFDPEPEPTPEPTADPEDDDECLWCCGFAAKSQRPECTLCGWTDEDEDEDDDEAPEPTPDPEPALGEPLGHGFPDYEPTPDSRPTVDELDLAAEEPPRFRVPYQLGLDSWQSHSSWAATPEAAIEEVRQGAREAGQHLTLGSVEVFHSDAWVDCDVYDGDWSPWAGQRPEPTPEILTGTIINRTAGQVLRASLQRSRVDCDVYYTTPDNQYLIEQWEVDRLWRWSAVEGGGHGPGLSTLTAACDHLARQLASAELITREPVWSSGPPVEVQAPTYLAIRALLEGLGAEAFSDRAGEARAILARLDDEGTDK